MSAIRQNIVMMQIEYGVELQCIEKTSFLLSICKKNEMNRLRNEEIEDDLPGRLGRTFV